MAASIRRQPCSGPASFGPSSECPQDSFGQSAQTGIKTPCLGGLTVENRCFFWPVHSGTLAGVLYWGSIGWGSPFVGDVRGSSPLETASTRVGKLSRATAALQEGGNGLVVKVWKCPPPISNGSHSAARVQQAHGLTGASPEDDTPATPLRRHVVSVR